MTEYIEFDLECGDEFYLSYQFEDEYEDEPKILDPEAKPFVYQGSSPDTQRHLVWEPDGNTWKGFDVNIHWFDSAWKKQTDGTFRPVVTEVLPL